MLLTAGLDKETIDELEVKSRAELDAAWPRYYILLEHVCAIRR
jgi:hypothetical protein